MSEIQVSHRFGWDMPSRIQATTDYFAGGQEMPLPGEPIYSALLPFPLLPGIGLPAGSASFSTPGYEVGPSRFDLSFPAGDDITVPVTFLDSAYPEIDMSDQANWQWYAHIRTGYGPAYPLVAEFACTSEYIPEAGEEEGQTKVTMVLSREDNWRSGNFYWDLQGVAPAPVVEGDPTPGSAHTLLSGRCLINSQVTTLPGEWPPSSGPYQGTSVFLAITVGGMKTVGPTGQVG